MPLVVHHSLLYLSILINTKRYYAHFIKEKKMPIITSTPFTIPPVSQFVTWDSNRVGNGLSLGANEEVNYDSFNEAGVQTSTFKSSGKYYYEWEKTGGSNSSGSMMFGIGIDGGSIAIMNSYFFNADYISYHAFNGRVFVNGSLTNTVAQNPNVGVICGIAWDGDINQFTAYLEGTQVYQTTYNPGNPVGPVFIGDQSGFTHAARAHFDPANWTYSPPPGFGPWTT